jgi:hypothetical protein
MSVLRRNEPPALPDPPQPKKTQEVIFTQAENFGGEIALKHEVMDAQIEYYKWGAAVFKLIITLFAIQMVLVGMTCLLSLLIPAYLTTIMEQIFRGLTSPSPGGYGS